MLVLGGKALKGKTPAQAHVAAGTVSPEQEQALFTDLESRGARVPWSEEVVETLRTEQED